jgi:hypothetical protein
MDTMFEARFARARIQVTIALNFLLPRRTRRTGSNKTHGFVA